MREATWNKRSNRGPRYREGRPAEGIARADTPPGVKHTVAELTSHLQGGLTARLGGL